MRGEDPFIQQWTARQILLSESELPSGQNSIDRRGREMRAEACNFSDLLYRTPKYTVLVTLTGVYFCESALLLVEILMYIL